MSKKSTKKIKRQQRIRAKIKGTKERPRLSVFRSTRYIYAQLINDESGKTIFGVSEKHLEERKNSAAQKTTKSDWARKLGFLVAKKAQEKKIKKVVFDRGSYAYHGRVKALAEEARKGGLEF